MLAFERRWTEAVLSGFAPPSETTLPARLAPHEGEVEYFGALDRMRGASTPLAQFGIRFAVWMAALSPIWMTGQLKTMVGVRPDQRAKILERLLEHRVFFVRELSMLLKIGACMALVGTPSVRARTHYDLTPPPRTGVDDEKNAKKPRALSLLRPVDAEGN